MRRWLFFLAWVCSTSMAHAQNASVQASSYRIRLGEQVVLKLKAQAAKDQKLIWPELSDSLGPYFDVVKRDTIDTLNSPGAPLQLEQQVFITSFDSGMHSLPVFDFQFIGAQGDTQSVLSDVLSINVLTQPVDTTKAIKDIRGLEVVPPDYTRLIWMIVGITLAVLLVAGGIYYYLRSRKPKETPKAPPAPQIPAWVLALKALDKVAQEALWQQGKEKEYHSALTDILREYLEKQFRIPAMESTTDETLQMVQKLGWDAAWITDLRQVLHLADLIKFAKVTALPAEHQRSLELCRLLVERSRPQDTTTTQVKGKEEADV